MSKVKKPFLFTDSKFIDLGMPVENLVVVPTTRKYLWGLWSKSDAQLYYTSGTNLYRLNEGNDLVATDSEDNNSSSNPPEEAEQGIKVEATDV